MKQDLGITEDIDDKTGVTIVKLRQDISMDTSPVLRRYLMHLLKKKGLHVVVDLQSIKKIDTSGLATLVEFAAQLRQKGGDIAVCGIHEEATDTLSLKQVENVLKMCRDCGEAMKKIETADPQT